MLAIVCSPSMSIRKSVANDSRRSMSSPLIIVFDSQQDRDSKIIENFIVDTIRQFLRVSFILKKFFIHPTSFQFAGACFVRSEGMTQSPNLPLYATLLAHVAPD
uniref:Uncharacterized protein n=1 Tax=Parascaris equorum TaxID=6256 RepID=A0A914S010_PAREQ